MTYTFHPDAEKDLVVALDFYARRAGISVAQRFKDEFERVAELLVKNLDLGTPSTTGRRLSNACVSLLCCISKTRQRHPDHCRPPPAPAARLWRK